MREVMTYDNINNPSRHRSYHQRLGTKCTIWRIRDFKCIFVILKKRLRSIGNLNAEFSLEHSFFRYLSVCSLPGTMGQTDHEMLVGMTTCGCRMEQSSQFEQKIGLSQEAASRYSNNETNYKHFYNKQYRIRLMLYTCGVFLGNTCLSILYYWMEESKILFKYVPVFLPCFQRTLMNAIWLILTSIPNCTIAVTRNATPARINPAVIFLISLKWILYRRSIG